MDIGLNSDTKKEKDIQIECNTTFFPTRINFKVNQIVTAIIRTDSLRKESIFGHVPQYILKVCLLILKVPNTSITAEVFGKRLIRGGYCLESPVIYHFQEQEKVINWSVKKLEVV